MPTIAILTVILAACGGGSHPAEDGSDGDPAGDDGFFLDPEESDAPRDDGRGEDAAEDPADTDREDIADAEEEESPPPPHVPEEISSELIFSSPAGVPTPPTWNANLPKLAGDGDFLYAIHTYYPQDDVSQRFAAVMRRPAAGPAGAWTEAARVSYPHQPPGIVMDASMSLHMVFDCLRPGAVDVTCFQGGAGTTGLSSRFYHLIFSARDGDGALRFDTYANYNEWTAHSNGYGGVGTTVDGVTFWSLADESWVRVVQYWAGPSSYGTPAYLTVPGAYLLYPVMAGDPAAGSASFILYAGEFNPADGSNAAYIASTGFLGSTSGFSQLFRRAPATPRPPGTTGAFPSDVAHGPDGTLYVLSYLPDGSGGCTELLRFDGGTGSPPTILPVGCTSTYAKLQVSSRGVLYLLTPGAGALATVGLSADRGETWTWHEVPLAGLPSNGDVRYFGYTPIKPYTSPAIFDPDRMVLFFSGYDAADLAAHSYMGVMALES